MYTVIWCYSNYETITESFEVDALEDIPKKFAEVVAYFCNDDIIPGGSEVGLEDINEVAWIHGVYQNVPDLDLKAISKESNKFFKAKMGLYQEEHERWQKEYKMQQLERLKRELGES